MNENSSKLTNEGRLWREMTGVFPWDFSLITNTSQWPHPPAHTHTLRYRHQASGAHHWEVNWLRSKQHGKEKSWEMQICTHPGIRHCQSIGFANWSLTNHIHSPLSLFFFFFSQLVCMDETHPYKGTMVMGVYLSIWRTESLHKKPHTEPWK